VEALLALLMLAQATAGTIDACALVAGRDVTVLPCYLQGAFRAWPKGRHLPCPKKVRLIVGEPRSYSSREANKIDICTITAELHHAVKKLGESNGSD